MLLKLFYFYFFFAAVALAVPTDLDESSVSNAHTLFARDKEYHCRESTDKKKENNKGALVANISRDKARKSARKAGLKPGKSGYPQRFYNRGGLKFAKPCNKKKHDIYEYPIVADQRSDYPKEQKGANPGRVRVYYDQYFNICGVGLKANKDNSGNPHLCT